MEEGAILVPASHVPTQRCPGDGIYLVQTTQTQLAVDKAAVDIRIDVIHIQLLDEHPPRGPFYLLWNQIPVLSDEEIALMREKGGVGVEEPERTLS